jgi:hypothetical protein
MASNPACHLRRVQDMSDKKEQLIDLVMNGNVSGIQILVDRLEIESEEVIKLIHELLEEGRLSGSLTEDGRRFFKSEVKLSEAPTIAREDSPPDFLSFNSKPAIATAIIGFLIMAVGLIINSMATDFVEQNFATMIIFVGLIVAMTGMYCVSQRKTPS